LIGFFHSEIVVAAPKIEKKTQCNRESESF